MVVKQAARMTCVCGQPIHFPDGEVRTKCKTKGCKAIWTCGAEGFWSVLAPIMAKPVIPTIVSKVQSRADRYRNYPKSRRKKGGRKN